MHAVRQLNDSNLVEFSEGDVLLRLSKEEHTALTAQYPSLRVFWSRAQRSWFYRPSGAADPFPSELLNHLADIPTSSAVRTYLQLPAGMEPDPALALEWDAYAKCWFYPCPPDLLPPSLHAYRPAPFSWQAWCQQRISPGTSLCQTSAPSRPLTDSVAQLATEMFRASFSRQRGFIYLRPTEPARAIDAWRAVHHMTHDHPTTVVVVTLGADIILWQNILAHFGTQPASVIVVPYRDIHLLDPRMPRDEQSQRKAAPSTYAAVSPDVVIWDHAHQLRSTERRSAVAADALASRAGWNLWLSANPAASPADLSFLQDLLCTRSERIRRWIFPAESDTPQKFERWLSWWSPTPERVLSSEIQSSIFARDSRGTIAGARHASVSPTRAIFRPIGTASLGADKAGSPQPRQWGDAHLSDLRVDLGKLKLKPTLEIVRSLLTETEQVVLICDHDEHLRALAEGFGNRTTSKIAVLESRSETPPELPIWLENFRCVLIHPTHLHAGPPLLRTHRSRTVLSLSVPTSVDEIARALSIAGPHSPIIFPYLLATDEFEVVRTIPVENRRLAIPSALIDLPIERF